MCQAFHQKPRRQQQVSGVERLKGDFQSRPHPHSLADSSIEKLYIANELAADEEEPVDSIRNGYPFSGYFLPYPDSEYEGLVTTINDDPPMLNWIYVDRETYEVKYGVRADAQEHLTGPFDCTKQDRRMTLEGWEGFVAVEEIPGVWALYYDQDDDGLRSKVPLGTRVLEVELTRREKKERKPEPDDSEPMTLDEKMKQHKAQTAQEEKERAQFLAQANGESDFMQQARQQAEAHGIDIDNLDESQAARLKEALQRLNLGGSPLIGALQSSIGSRSERTNESATWSEAERHDADASESVTVASSVMDHGETMGSVAGVLQGNAGSVSDGSVYQKPYVEDDA